MTKKDRTTNLRILRGNKGEIRVFIIILKGLSVASNYLVAGSGPLRKLLNCYDSRKTECLLNITSIGR